MSQRAFRRDRPSTRPETHSSRPALAISTVEAVRLEHGTSQPRASSKIELGSTYLVYRYTLLLIPTAAETVNTCSFWVRARPTHPTPARDSTPLAVPAAAPCPAPARSASRQAVRAVLKGRRVCRARQQHAHCARHPKAHSPRGRSHFNASCDPCEESCLPAAPLDLRHGVARAGNESAARLIRNRPVCAYLV